MMFINCNGMNEKIRKINYELNKIINLEGVITNFKGEAPDGELFSRKDGNRFKWYVKNNNQTLYLPKSERKLAEKLALKKYCNLKKKELETELSACNGYIRKMHSCEGKADDLLLQPEYAELLQEYFSPLNKELQEWQNSDYERCQKYNDTLIVKGTQGKMVRSKSEAIIDMILYKNKIPFRYEEKLILNGVTIYPDFTVRHPINGKTMYWEHFGMMDDENYANHACDKIRLYCQNGIIPSIQLICTFETRSNPLNIENVEDIVSKYFT